MKSTSCLRAAKTRLEMPDTMPEPQQYLNNVILFCTS